MKKILLAVFTILSCTALAQSSLAVRKSKLKELDFMLGKWQVVAEETNSEKESFVQEGTLHCYYDMDSTTIRRDHDYTVTKSSGYYNSLPRKRPFHDFVIYNNSKSGFELVDFDGGVIGPARTLLYDPRTKTIKYYFSFYHPVRKVTLDAVAIMKIVSDTELILTQELNSVESDFKEYYKSSFKRIK